MQEAWGAWGELAALLQGCPSALGWAEAFGGEAGLTLTSKDSGPNPALVCLFGSHRGGWRLDCLCWRARCWSHGVGGLVVTGRC